MVVLCVHLDHPVMEARDKCIEKGSLQVFMCSVQSIKKFHMDFHMDERVPSYFI